ncbi:MAG: T9SS type A sorting domain-containing protein [Bacteroidia bacterium]
MMKKVLQLISFLVIVEFANAQTFDWAFKLKTDGLGSDMLLDNSGNLIIIGYINDTMDLDPGPDTFNLSGNGNRNVLVAKYSPIGNFINAFTLNGVSVGFGTSIKITQSNDILIGGMYYDSVDFDPGAGTQILDAEFGGAFILKLDSIFNFIWVKSFDQNTQGNGGTSPLIEIDDFGNIYCTAYFRGTFDFDPGPLVYNLSSITYSQLLLELDSTGSFIWAKAVSGSDPITPFNIYLDNENNIYTSGSFLGTIDFDPDTGIYNLSVNPNTIQWSDNDVFVSKYDSIGSFIWAKSFGGKEHDWNTEMKIDGGKYLLLVGGFNDTVDFDPGPGIFNLQVDSAALWNQSDSYILKLDTAGNFIWAKQFKKKVSGPPSITYSFIRTLIIDSLQNIIVGGGFRGDSTDFDPGPSDYYLTPAGSDFYFVVLDSSGNFISANRIGNSSCGAGLVNAINGAYGNYLFCGDFWGGSIDFDFGPSNYVLTSDSSYASFFLLSVNYLNTGYSENMNLTDNNILVFPNPYITSLTVKSTTQKGELIIFDVTGKEILRTKTFNEETKINTAHLTPGFYFINYREENRSVNKKVVKL